MKTLRNYIKEDIFDIENTEPIKNVNGYEIKDMGKITSITKDQISISKKESISKHSQRILDSIINRENFEELVNISRITGIKYFSFNNVIIDIDGSMNFLGIKIRCIYLSINNNLNVNNLNIMCEQIKIMKISKFKNCDIDCMKFQMYDHKIPKFINCNVECNEWGNSVSYELFIDEQLRDKVLNEFKERQLIKEFGLNNIPSSTSESCVGLCVMNRDWSQIGRHWMMFNKILNNKDYERVNFDDFNGIEGKIIGDWKIVGR